MALSSCISPPLPLPTQTCIASGPPHHRRSKVPTRPVTPPLHVLLSPFHPPRNIVSRHFSNIPLQPRRRDRPGRLRRLRRLPLRRLQSRRQQPRWRRHLRQRRRLLLHPHHAASRRSRRGHSHRHRHSDP